MPIDELLMSVVPHACMRELQGQVREFMFRGEQATPNKPVVLNNTVAILRLSLVYEEFKELVEAMGFTVGVEFQIALVSKEFNLVRAYDAVLDLLYVVIGCAVSMGLDLEPGWQAVHQANLSKLTDRVVRDPMGKVLRGPGYKPADLAEIVKAQLSLPEDETPNAS